MSALYLALGDSITAGYGVGQSNVFTWLYYQSLLRSAPGVRYVNMGVNGLTSHSLLNMLKQRRNRNLLSEADLITITIGSNDLLKIGKNYLRGKPVNISAIQGDLQRNLILTGSFIRSVNPAAVVKIASVYNPINEFGSGLSSETQSLVRIANNTITNTGRSYGFIIVPVDRAFRGREQELLGPDKLHPNAMGQSVIANLFAASV